MLVPYPEQFPTRGCRKKILVHLQATVESNAVILNRRRISCVFFCIRLFICEFLSSKHRNSIISRQASLRYDKLLSDILFSGHLQHCPFHLLLHRLLSIHPLSCSFVGAPSSRSISSPPWYKTSVGRPFTRSLEANSWFLSLSILTIRS